MLDLERFCTGSTSSVLSMDPTFNSGPFYVTCKNLMVENDRGYNPALLGPILIHQTKPFSPFYYLASSLIRLNPNYCHLKTYGTDGEPELIKAFNVFFLMLCT